MLLKLQEEYIKVTGGIYQDVAPKNFPAQLKQTVLQDIPINLPSGQEPTSFFDYAKIAIDNDPNSPYFNSLYAFSHLLWFDDLDEHGNRYGVGSGFVTLRNNIISKKRLGFASEFNPQSTIVGPNGIIYVGEEGGNGGFEGMPVTVTYSLDGGKNFVKSIVSPGIPELQRNSCGEGRTSLLSNHAWNIYAGPELAVNKQGRLYAAWSRPKDCIEDVNFEFLRYGRDFDVFVSYSDNRGVFWSQPVKVNDDNSGGDQGFANIKVDDNGVVYVAFLDHRENQDKTQFDVYLAKSDNGGLSFSRNIKINDVGVPNIMGWREPGDYLDMLAVGKTKVFVSHPCVNLNYPQNGQPSDACITTISKMKS